MRSRLDQKPGGSNKKLKCRIHSVRDKAAQASHQSRDIILIDNSIPDPDKATKKALHSLSSLLTLKKIDFWKVL